jgi:glyoxylase-like metal-dependent hydrolase (beta-lactamase superfamily II)
MGRSAATVGCLAVLALAACAPGRAATPAPAPAAGAADELAPGVFLVRGGFVRGHQPDGNSVVFRAPEGAIVFDTGRHAEHTQRVLDRVAALGLVPKVIVNSHWHLDHVSGNVLVRQRFPSVQVLASDAIDEALTGFLAGYRKQLEEVIAKPETTAEAKEGYRQEIARIDAGKQLGPTEVVRESGRRTLAGLPVEIHLETRAVTAGDVWLYDPASKVAAAGDLVTLPVPFLDTACPRRWSQALANLEQEPWEVLVPGHGAPMSRADLAVYRKAFDGLVACAGTKVGSSKCVHDWLRDGGELVTKNDPESRAGDMVEYYVTAVLRGDPARVAKACG